MSVCAACLGKTSCEYYMLAECPTCMNNKAKKGDCTTCRGLGFKSVPTYSMCRTCRGTGKSADLNTW